MNWPKPSETRLEPAAEFSGLFASRMRPRAGQFVLKGEEAQKPRLPGSSCFSALRRVSKFSVRLSAGHCACSLTVHTAYPKTWAQIQKLCSELGLHALLFPSALGLLCSLGSCVSASSRSALPLLLSGCFLLAALVLAFDLAFYQRLRSVLNLTMQFQEKINSPCSHSISQQTATVVALVQTWHWHVIL